MTRCDYDGIFYRVFCVTLLAIALTFTVILTNVFIDIDGLLSFKGREKAQSTQVIQNSPNSLTINSVPKLDPYDDEDKDYEELDENYRTKRSLESQNVLFHITNPKVKNILTSRLANLLEKLDEEEPTPNIKNDKDNEKSKESIKKMDDIEPLEDTKMISDDKFLHLAMHNILLQGIIDHMDINEIYKRINSFMKNFKGSHNLKETIKHPLKLLSKNLSPNEESKFLNELLNCKELHDQIMETSEKYEDKENRRNAKGHKESKVLIKTVIDIKSMVDDRANKNNYTNEIDNIKGIIKLIYNGKSIKINHMDDVTTPPITNTVKTTSTTQKYSTKIVTEEVKFEDVSDSLELNRARLRKSYFNKIFSNYFKKLTKLDNSDSAEMSQIGTKRLKRHVRIRYDNEPTTQISKIKKNEKDDDELYVEIETHFDSKGLKGEKKKKLIRNLIQKIQNALHDSGDVNKSRDKKNKYKHVHVKKRTQDPLDNNKLLSKLIPEHNDPIIHRQLDPISKTVASHENVPNIYDNTGENWKKTYTGPGFLSKSINSAERHEVDTQYSKLMNTNDISQRMQKPLNSEDSEEVVGANSYFDLGNLKFLIKEIDGAGFSVGFNQYVDEPPDTETIKLFTGLENIIQNYHQKYDPVVTTETEDNATEKFETPNNDYVSAENSKTEHVMVRRSIKGHDYHSNEYKIIYDNNYLPYKNYQEIYEDGKRKLHSVKDYHKHIKFTSKDMNTPLVVDEDIFKKDLKPAEILGLANLLDRKKRGTNVKHILNLKNKIKMNKYLNTKTMANKKIFMNKKRIKREVNKIRIIATDLPNQHRQSDENVFLVSDENMFANRALVREVSPPQVVEDSGDKAEEHYDYISPYIYEESKEPTYITNVFDGKSRHNALMSKYPHIFLEEISKSKEQFLPDTVMYSQPMAEAPPDIIDSEQTGKILSTEATVMKHPQSILDDELSDLAVPKSNYKLTVKIMPRNLTDTNTGFKEIHTSINKSYNKNGMIYSSLVNVSEISKIVKLNRTKIGIEVASLTTMSPIVKIVNEQQSKINRLLKQHKYNIDEQLEHLNKEKQRLLSMLTGKKETQIVVSKSNELFDLVLPTNPLKVVKVTKEEMSNLAAMALSKTHGYFGANNQGTTAALVVTSTEDSTATSPHTTTTSITTSTVAPTITTTTEVPTTVIDHARIIDKIKILNTIEKNDKLTNEILKKIDKNTEILQTFLTKLLDSLPLHTTRRSVPSNDVNVPSKINLNEPMFNWKDQPMRDALIYQPAANAEVQKYDNHVSIPFVYAYQKPYHTLDSKLKNPVQSIIYQGHIHTNTIMNKGDFWKPNDMKPKQPIPVKNGNTKRDVNQTRFFVDELENDFKISFPLRKKTEISVPGTKTATNVTAH